MTRASGPLVEAIAERDRLILGRAPPGVLGAGEAVDRGDAAGREHELVEGQARTFGETCASGFEVDPGDRADAELDAIAVDHRRERATNGTTTGHLLVQPHALHEVRPSVREHDLRFSCGGLSRQPVRKEEACIAAPDHENSTSHTSETRWPRRL